MAIITSYKICPKCNGTGDRIGFVSDGQGGYIEIDGCLMCNSTGYISIGKIDADTELSHAVEILQNDMDKALRRLKKIMQKLNIEGDD